MRTVLTVLERFTREVNRVFAIISCMIVLTIVAIIVREVFFRYALNAPSVWAMDSSSFALMFVFFLALAPALQSGHHVHVDLFDPLVPARWHRAQRVVGHILTVFFGAVLFWYLLESTIDAFYSDEMTYSVVPVPLKYIYWIGPVGAFEFVLTAIVITLRAWFEPVGPDGKLSLSGH